MAMFEPFSAQPFTADDLWERLSEVVMTGAIFPEEDADAIACWLQNQQIKIKALRDMGLWSEEGTHEFDTFPWTSPSLPDSDEAQAPGGSDDVL